MFHVLDSKTASGEILLLETWEEDSAGFNDERTTGAKLTVSPEGNIILTEYIEYKPTFSRPSKNEHVYKISVPDLIELIKKNSL